MLVCFHGLYCGKSNEPPFQRAVTAPSRHTRVAFSIEHVSTSMHNRACWPQRNMHCRHIPCLSLSSKFLKLVITEVGDFVLTTVRAQSTLSHCGCSQRSIGVRRESKWDRLRRRPPDVTWPELCTTAPEKAECSLPLVLGTTTAQGGSPTELCEGDAAAWVLWVRTRAGPVCVHLPAGSSGPAPQELRIRTGELKTTCVTVRHASARGRSSELQEARRTGGAIARGGN